MRKIISGAVNKFQSSYWLSSGSYSLLNKVTTTLLAFVNFMILTRALPTKEFGEWSLYFTIVTLMEMAKHGFVRNPLIRYLTINGDDESPKIQTASMYLNAVIGIVEVFVLGGCALFLGEFWAADDLPPLFLIYMVSTVILIPINHFDIVQQARFQFKGTFLSNLVRQGGLFLYIVYVFFTGGEFELTSLAIAQCIAILASGFLSYLFAKKFVSFSPNLDRKWFNELFHYGKFTFGTNVSSTIYKNIDSWMLARMLVNGPEAVAIFSPAMRVSNLVEVPTDTLTSVLFPQLSKRIATEGLSTAKYLYEKAVGTLTAIMLPFVLGVIYFAEEVILIIAGPKYMETVPILQVTMVFGLIIPFNRMMGITLDAIGKAQTNFAYVVLNMVINIVSNFFYIRHFGTIGAAYGTLTTYLISLVYNQYYLYNNLNIRLTGVFKHFLDFYGKMFSFGIKFLRRTFA
jgi:lipopolysaccharide exporter